MKKILSAIISVILFCACSQKKCDCESGFESGYSYPIDSFTSVYLDMNNEQYCLTEKQVNDLLSVINDTLNYMDGDCGTTYKDGSFIFNRKDEGNCKLVSEIKFGCNYAQLYFYPETSKFKYGHLTLEASEQLSNIVSEIKK